MISQAKIDELIRVSWDLRNKLEASQQIIYALAAALRNTGVYLENEKRNCWCGGGNAGGIAIPHQDYCKQANAALAAAVEYKGENEAP